MKTIFSSKRHHYVAKACTFLIAVALIAGMVGCVGVEYDLAIASTAGGSVTTPGEGTFTYDEGTVVNLTAEAEEGYYFINWTGDLDTIADVNAVSTTITMNDNYSINANFQEDEVVHFADPNLEAVIREAIGKPEGDIYASELESLTCLSAKERGIENLSGLEYCIGLTELYLENGIVGTSLLGVGAIKLDSGQPNEINDLSPLAYCTNITYLDLSGNNITDISPLANLSNLTKLLLGSNRISDISPVANLTSLTRLCLDRNQISDISPVANLTNLTILSVEYNQVSDVSPLANVTDLIHLHLAHNQISDIYALANLTNLVNVYLSFNEIGDISSVANLTNLRYLKLYHNEIEDVSPLAGLPGNRVECCGYTMLNITLGHNLISDISPLGNLTAPDELYLYLGENLISDLPPLNGLTNLYVLRLRMNHISDISPLADLTRLAALDLYHNNVEDISPLSSLSDLSHVNLEDNQISDISALVENEGLGTGDYIWLESNPLSEDSINIYIPELEARGVNVDY